MNASFSCFKLSRAVMGEHVPLDHLRLELNSSCFYLLSYHHMEIAKFEFVQDCDTLTISFLNHRVRMTGKNLRELAIAIQSRSVESIKPIAGRYGAAVGSETGFVEAIEIEPTNNSHSA